MANERLYESAAVWDQQLQEGQRNLIQAILDHWPAGVSTALDVGCGDGKITHVLAERTDTRFHGFDGSSEALSRLRLPSTHGDVANLPFDDAAFDLVMTTDVFEHLSDDVERAAWAELFRVAHDWVFFAVPFREALLDATACCAACGSRYHVNWHHRSYDIPGLIHRAPAGWTVAGIILSGEAWSPMLPPETAYRRLEMDEWAGWDEAVCPACSTKGSAADIPQALPDDVARALGLCTYSLAANKRFIRSHSEILVAFCRADQVTLRRQGMDTVESEELSAALWLSHHGIVDNLDPYPQAARMVAAVDGGAILQLPVYPASIPCIRFVGRQAQTVAISIEDGTGLLFQGDIGLLPEQPVDIELPRPVQAGYYGLLIRMPSAEPLQAISLQGNAPILTRLLPQNDQAGYYTIPATKIHVQAVRSLWIDRSALTPQSSFYRDGENALLVKEIARLERNLLQRTNLAEQERSTFSMELSARSETLRVALDESQRLKNELSEAIAQCSERQFEYEQASRERDILAAELSAKDAALAAALREGNQLESSLAAVRAECSSLRHQLDRMNRVNDDLTAKLSAKASILDSIVDQKNKLEIDLAELHRQYAEQQTDLEQVKRRREVRAGQWIRQRLGKTKK